MAKVSIDGLKGAVMDILNDYSEDALERANAATKAAAKVGVAELKSFARSSGISGTKYVNSFSSKLLQKGRLGDTYVLYCRPPYYRLAHLLEYGHTIVGPGGKRTGGRTKAYHHWTEVEADMTKLLEDTVIKEISRLK